MSEQATETQATEIVDTSTTVETNADAQSMSQEGTAETTNNVDSKPSKDASIVAKPAEPVAEETKQAESVPVKPSYEGMIQGFIDGDLTEEDYTAIEKSGLSREQFEIMAEGYKARQEKSTQDLYSWVGGEKEYNSLKEFGAANLGEFEIEAFNEAINSNNPNLAKMAVLGLRAMYQEQKGAPPAMRIESDGSTQQAVEGFTSQQEVIKALNDRRYGKDQEYTNTVNQRRAKSVY